MTQVQFGPVNITYGNSALFTAEFYDANGNVTTPLSATLAITYTNLTLVSQTDSVALTPTGSFLTGTWSSVNAIPGLAPWTITVTGQSTAAQIGTIRVIDP
jgi:hypothetical protein